MDAITSQTKYKCLLFDMDDTLYPVSTGMNLACGKNIQEYMLHRLGIEESQVPKMCLDLYKEYGTTMAGLKALGYEFDNDEFHEYVHGKLPYEKLKPDLVLRNLLLSMPQRKLIFTNADKAHAARVLSKLGLEDCFEGVICFETLNPPSAAERNETKSVKNYVDHGFFADTGSDSDGDGRTTTNRIVCKPSMEAMEAAFRIANIDPCKTVFFEDSARNVATGKAAGLHTVFVGSSGLVPGADVALESIHNIREALPEIWEGEDEFEAVAVAVAVASNAVEAVVTA